MAFSFVHTIHKRTNRQLNLLNKTKQKTIKQNNKKSRKVKTLSNKTLFTCYTFFSWFFSVITRSSPSSSSQHIFASRQNFFFLIENTENTQKKTAWTIPSDILALLSFFHSHSHFFILLPQAPTLFFPLFLLVSHWLSGLAHLLWVGGAYPLLIGDSLADQVLCSLRGSLGTRDGHLPVPSSGDELAFLGDLDPGAGQLLVLH